MDPGQEPGADHAYFAGSAHQQVVFENTWNYNLSEAHPEDGYEINPGNGYELNPGNGYNVNLDIRTSAQGVMPNAEPLANSSVPALYSHYDLNNREIHLLESHDGGQRDDLKDH